MNRRILGFLCAFVCVFGSLAIARGPGPWYSKFHATLGLIGSKNPFVTRLPGIPTGVPASDRWGLYLLAGGLFGLGLLAATLRKQSAA